MKLFKKLIGRKTTLESALEKTDVKVNPVFKINGVQYYEFDDIFSMHSGRAFAALDFFNELEMKCTREYLQAHTEATREMIVKMRDCVRGVNGELNLIGIAEQLVKFDALNNQLGERLDMIIDRDSAFKLASVVYFDDNESPFDYDFKYNIENKIPIFKKEGNDFFLRTPLKKLIGFTNIAQNDLVKYLEAQKTVNHLHLDDIFTNISAMNTTKDWFQILKSLKSLD